MKLTLDQIRTITGGAEEVAMLDDGIHFLRFNRHERELYEERTQTGGVFAEGFYDKTFASAGVRLSFKTNSTSLALAFSLRRVGGRNYFGVDIHKDGELLLHYDNLSECDADGNVRDFNGTSHRITAELGEGEKEIVVRFPWSAEPSLKEVVLDDGASLSPSMPRKKILVYGDSITQGYDALYPSKRYSSVVADALGALEYNKGIGGEVFWPALAEIKQDFVPDYISVAYGTNDWGRGVTYPEFLENCKQFFANLRKNYPETPIIALTPIWRDDANGQRKLGDISLVAEHIARMAEEYGLVLIYGIDLVPHEKPLFADLRLHPNDEGFGYYAASVISVLTEKGII